jgi:2-keto-4-pentenoate hydratase/2-oxohepta-3-ene-1,7-dioic acid hydratase in catechol pathway
MMMAYKLASYRSEHGPRAGAVVGATLYDVATLTSDPAYRTVMDVLDDWDKAHEMIADAAARPACAGWPVGSMELLAPVSRPGAIYCIGSNYKDHAEEMRIASGRSPQPDARTLGMAPFFFIKSSHAIAGPGSTVGLSEYSARPDWEIELVVVIGRTGRDLAAHDALDIVAGYTVGNDLSARDLSVRTQIPAGSLFRADWLRHKSFDNSAPMGPWITPAAYLRDPSDLRMRLWVNGALKQDSTSAQMIYSAAEQIAHISAGITLYPGDLIMTGTPAGVGAGRGEYLRPGDTVRMDIAEIGEMSFRIA